jgi:hypothetical protein
VSSFSPLKIDGSHGGRARDILDSTVLLYTRHRDVSGTSKQTNHCFGHISQQRNTIRALACLELFLLFSPRRRLSICHANNGFTITKRCSLGRCRTVSLLIALLNNMFLCVGCCYSCWLIRKKRVIYLAFEMFFCGCFSPR